MEYTVKVSEQFLQKDEQEVFSEHLDSLGLQPNIWPVFASMFSSGTRHSRPLVARVFDDSGLQGAAIVIRCTRYGKSVFSNRILAGFINTVKIPYILWIKFGCCMDMLSNPGFSRVPGKSDQINEVIIDHLRKSYGLVLIYDYADRSAQYKFASKLPALPHGVINCREMTGIGDYLGRYKNLKKKIKVFEKKGGVYEIEEGSLSGAHMESLKHCFLATAEKSILYLPYQDLYLDSAVITSTTPIEKVYYFIATLEGAFLGYQAAIHSGRHLNALHGAFDRSRKSTYHVYDILFLRMTEFALDKGIASIDFGSVLNQTKEKMVNDIRDMSYFIFSKHRPLRIIFKNFLKRTRIQGKEHQRYMK